MTDTHDPARCKTCGQFLGDHGTCVTPGCEGNDVDACSYCDTPFESTDLYWLTPHATTLTADLPVRIARCHACTAVHRQGTCGTCNTEAYHPTEDNTPFGRLGCRVCTHADPFTNLMGFVGTAIRTAQQMKHLIAAMKDASLAKTVATESQEFVSHVAVTQRFHGDIHVGDRLCVTITDAVHAGYVAGAASMLRAVQKALEPFV